MDSKNKGSYQGWNDVRKSEKNNSLNPHFTKDKAKNIYQFWQKANARDLLNLIKEKDYRKFCELGSGRATTSLYLSNAGYTDITLVDLAEEGLQLAMNTFKKYDFPQPNIKLENVEQTSLPSSSFDCVYNIGLLEHFEEPEHTLRESFRLLRNGGMIFMPIVPKISFSKSIIYRLVFNPLSIAKHLLKKILKINKEEYSNILRTSCDEKFYIDKCQQIGFNKTLCIPYNAYQKVNNDGSFMDKIVFSIYNKHYNFFNKKKKISFRTSPILNCCYLLVAYKES